MYPYSVFLKVRLIFLFGPIRILTQFSLRLNPNPVFQIRFVFWLTFFFNVGYGSGLRFCLRSDPDPDSVFLWGQIQKKKFLWDRIRNRTQFFFENGSRLSFFLRIQILIQSQFIFEVGSGFSFSSWSGPYQDTVFSWGWIRIISDRTRNPYGGSRQALGDIRLISALTNPNRLSLRLSKSAD